MTSPKLRLLMTADAVGGVWQYSLDLARALAPLGVETILAVLGPSPSAAQLKLAAKIPGLTLIDTGLPLDWLAADRGTVRSAGRAVAKLAKEHEADVVQLNAPALGADVEFPAPVLAVAHSCIATWWSAVKGTAVDADFGWRAELTGQGLRSAEKAVAPTAAFAAAIQEAYGLDEVPMAVHNGRTPLTLPRVAPHDFAFTAGRLWDKGKNAETLDRAAERLAVPFYAAGSTRGPNGDSITLYNVHGLGSLGEREIARWLAARPVFASAAVYEPFGLAVLEAAAAGCPLVLSDIPTFRELWDDVAVFVPAMDHAGFASAVTSIVGDDMRRTQLGAAAKERANRYTPEAMAASMARIYADLAGAEDDEADSKAAA